ncbi:MAG TPA: ABA4-like family protein [Rubrivivax sp.]|nr:ABA4-like family protein [Rubrivivax sp.]
MDSLSPDLFFRSGNLVALTGWLALALSPPSWHLTPRVWQLTGWVLPLGLGAAYIALLLAHWGPGGFGSLAEVRQLFDRPGLLAAGWLHYLAFDLFVGTWIARQAATVGLPHWAVLPCFALTFMFGPAGLLAFALVSFIHPRLPR